MTPPLDWASQDQVMTLTDVCRFFKWTPRTVQRRVALGSFPAPYVRGRWNKDVLKHWFEGGALRMRRSA